GARGVRCSQAPVARLACDAAARSHCDPGDGCVIHVEDGCFGGLWWTSHTPEQIVELGGPPALESEFGRTIYPEGEVPAVVDRALEARFHMKPAFHRYVDGWGRQRWL